jgi:hypothetical protein
MVVHRWFWTLKSHVNVRWGREVLRWGLVIFNEEKKSWCNKMALILFCFTSRHINITHHPPPFLLDFGREKVRKCTSFEVFHEGVSCEVLRGPLWFSKEWWCEVIFGNEYFLRWCPKFYDEALSSLFWAFFWSGVGARLIDLLIPLGIFTPNYFWKTCETSGQHFDCLCCKSVIKNLALWGLKK